MWGQGEFDNSAGAGGMATLLEAVATTGTAPAVEIPVVEAVEVTVLHNAGQTIAGQEHVAAPQQLENGPDIESLDIKRLEEARKISQTNKPANEKLNGWKPLNTKPRVKELWQAIVERDSTKKPKNWDLHDMVKWLLTNSPAIPQTQAGQQDLQNQANVSPITNAIVAVVQRDSDGQGPKPRWSRNKFARVICIICMDDLKEDFINRDRKLDRQEMDAKGANSFWEKVAIVFNSSRVFDIDKVRGQQQFKTLSAGPCAYVADAAKLKYEFGQMRASLTKALVNFQKSGQGDDEVREDAGDEQEAILCGSNFRDFCAGDELLEYFEFMLRKADLIDAATCNMPAQARYDHKSKRRTASQPDSQPKPKKKKKGGKEKHMQVILSALRQLPPVKLHKTRVQLAAEKAQGVRTLVKTHMGLEKVVTKQESRLRDAEHEVRILQLGQLREHGDGDGSSDEGCSQLEAAQGKVTQIKRLLKLVVVKQSEVMRNLAEAEQSEEESVSYGDDPFDVDDEDDKEDDEDSS